MRWWSSGTLFYGGGGPEEVGDWGSSEGKGECSVRADGDGSWDGDEGFHVCRSCVAISLDIEYTRSRLALVITTRIERVSRKGLCTDNSLQKSIAFTPLAPKAGPTGGDGVAFPAGTKIFYSIQKRTVELESVDVEHRAESDGISTYYDLRYC